MTDGILCSRHDVANEDALIFASFQDGAKSCSTPPSRIHFLKNDETVAVLPTAFLRIIALQFISASVSRRDLLSCLM